MKIKCQETESFINVSNLFTSTTKEMENIISYIKMYLNKTSDYIEKLKALNQKFTPKSKLHPSTLIEEYFHRLQVVVNAQIISLNTLIESLKIDIKKCEINLSEQIECQKKFKKEMIDAEDDYSTKFEEIKQAKRNYDNDATTLENILKSLEKKRRVCMKNSLDQDLLEDMGSSVKELIDSEKKYSRLINRSNIFKGAFLDRANASTGSTQQLQKEIERIAEEIVFKMMLCLQMSSKKVSLEVDTFAIDIDQQSQLNLLELNDKALISSSSSSTSALESLQDFHFEPYKLKLFSNDTVDGLSEEEMHNVITGMYETLKQKAIEYDVEFEGNKIQMNTVIRKLLSFNIELHLRKEDINTIDNSIKDKRLRDYFLQRLSDLRNRGEFQWPKLHFKEVGRILRLILDEIVNSFDMQTAKNVIILSQTFYYKENSLPSAKKIFLQILILKHPIFQNTDFWEKYMLDAIENEMNDYNKKNQKQKLRSKQTEEDSKMKLSNVIFSQMVPITDNMVNFDLQKEQIEKILDTVLLKYPLTEMHEEIVYSVFDKKDSTSSMKRNEKRKLSGDDLNSSNSCQINSLGTNMKKSMSFKDKSSNDNKNSNNAYCHSISNMDDNDMTMMIKTQNHYIDISSKNKGNEINNIKNTISTKDDHLKNN